VRFDDNEVVHRTKREESCQYPLFKYHRPLSTSHCSLYWTTFRGPDEVNHRVGTSTSTLVMWMRNLDVRRACCDKPYRSEYWIRCLGSCVHLYSARRCHRVQRMSSLLQNNIIEFWACKMDFLFWLASELTLKLSFSALGASIPQRFSLGTS